MVRKVRYWLKHGDGEFQGKYSSTTTTQRGGWHSQSWNITWCSSTQRTVRACNFPWPSRIHPSISSYALVPFLPCFVLSFFFTSYFLLPFPSTSRVFYSTTQPVPSCSSIIDPQSLFSRLIRFVDKTPLPSSLPHSFSSCFSQET